MLDKVKVLWGKNPMVVLGVGALILVLLVFVWDRILKALSYVSDKAKSIGSGLSTDKAKALASSIFSEVNSMATDEDLIVDIVKDLSLADYHKVQAEFGIVPYSATFDNFDSLTGSDSNLTEVLNKTLSENDKEKIKQAAPFLPIG